MFGVEKQGRRRFVVDPWSCGGGQFWRRHGMKEFSPAFRLIAALGISLGLVGLADAHSGIVDGYGCHRGTDKVTYHCHQGQFAGRAFKSKEDFLRELRGAPSERLSPKNNPAQVKKSDE
jgi:hypothetical protein